MAYRLRYDLRFMRLLEALPGDVRSIARQRVKALANEPYCKIRGLKSSMSILAIIACGCHAAAALFMKSGRMSKS